jgi:hypothetical protein
MRRPIGIVITLIFVMSLFGASPAQAVCPPIDGWPAFTDVAEEAQRVVIGTVVEAEDGLATRFRVDEILRGRAQSSLDLARLRSRLGREADTCTFSGTVAAEVDDRLAIAFSGKVKGWKGKLDSVALVDSDADHPNASELQRFTIQQVRLLLGHEIDGSTVALPDRSGPPPDLLASLLRSLPGGFLDLAADLLGYGSESDPESR